MSNIYTKFSDIERYVEKSITKLEITKRQSLREIGKFLRRTIRNKHGKYGAGWLKSNSSPTSPLLKTGELQRAVSFRTTPSSVEIYSKKEWLALIHEYGVTYTMSDKQRRFLMGVVFKNKPKKRGRPRKSWKQGRVTIPARPIWRSLLKLHRNHLETIVDKSLENIFL